jgi:transcriptional regulator with XRE-family HTH domain
MRPTSPPETARALLAENLVRLRRERQWTQEELAAQADLDRSFIAHVERRARNISLDNLDKLALAFDVPVSSLLQKAKPQRSVL